MQINQKAFLPWSPRWFSVSLHAVDSWSVFDAVKWSHRKAWRAGYCRMRMLANQHSISNRSQWLQTLICVFWRGSPPCQNTISLQERSLHQHLLCWCSDLLFFFFYSTSRLNGKKKSLRQHKKTPHSILGCRAMQQGAVWCMFYRITQQYTCCAATWENNAEWCDVI